MTSDVSGAWPRPPLRRAAARGFFWSVVEAVGGNLFSLIIFLFLARLLTPSDFGLVALAVVFIRFAVDPVEQGLGDAVVQRHELEREHADSAFWLGLACTVSLGIASVLLAPWAATLLDEPRLTPIIRALSVTFPLAGLRSVQEALLRRHLHFRALAMRTFSASAVGGLLGVAMASAGFGVWSLVAQRIATGVVAVGVLWSVSSWRPGFRFSWRHVSSLATFSISRTSTRLLQVSSRRIPDLLIGVLLGPVALGFFTVGQRLVQAMLQVLTAATARVALPAFSRLQGEPGRVRDAFYLVTRMSSLVGFPAFIALALLAPTLVPLLFGPHWAASIPVMQVLAIWGLTQCVSHFNTTVMTAMGKPQWGLGFAVLGSALTAVFIAAAAPHGITAVAFATLGRSIVVAPLAGVVLRRLIGYENTRYFRQFVPPLVAAVAMAALMAGLHAMLDGHLPPLGILGLQIGAGLVGYVGLVAVLAPGLLTMAGRLASEVLPPSLHRRRAHGQRVDSASRPSGGQEGSGRQLDAPQQPEGGQPSALARRNEV